MRLPLMLAVCIVNLSGQETRAVINGAVTEPNPTNILTGECETERKGFGSRDRPGTRTPTPIIPRRSWGRFPDVVPIDAESLLCFQPLPHWCGQKSTSSMTAVTVSWNACEPTRGTR